MFLIVEHIGRGVSWHVVSWYSQESSREFDAVGYNLFGIPDTRGAPPELTLLGVVVPLHVTGTSVDGESAVLARGVVLAGVLGLLGVVAAVGDASTAGHRLAKSARRGALGYTFLDEGVELFVAVLVTPEGCGLSVSARDVVGAAHAGLVVAVREEVSE